MTPQAKQYAGSAAVAIGLLDGFMSFGLLITRKNDGESHYNWLGADDFFVLSLLLLGSGFMAYAGKALYMAGDNEDILKNDTGCYTDRRDTRHTSITKSPPPTSLLQTKINNHMDTAYKYALAASGTFLVMCFYAFLGGFGGTPTPESHIGPNQDKNTQMTGFFMLYGAMAILATATFIKTASEKSGPCHFHATPNH